MIELIDKLARVFSLKYNLSRFGYTFDDIKSLVAENYFTCREKYKEDYGVKFETYVSKSVNNAILDVIKRESKKPLNNSFNCIDDESGKIDNDANEWGGVRDVLLKFVGKERLIVKELIDPSEQIIKTVRAIMAKREYSVQCGINKHYHFHVDLLTAIRLTYGFSLCEFKASLGKIKKKISGKNFFC